MKNWKKAIIITKMNELLYDENINDLNLFDFQ